MSLFASAGDDSAAALTALTDLVQPGERIFILQVPDILVPDGLVPVKAAKGVQMVARRRIQGAPPEAKVGAALSDADAPEMVALAHSPSRDRSWLVRMSWGIYRHPGRRAARRHGWRALPVSGHTEVSGVCTHPDFRSGGLPAAFRRRSRRASNPAASGRSCTPGKRTGPPLRCTSRSDSRFVPRSMCKCRATGRLSASQGRVARPARTDAIASSRIRAARISCGVWLA